MKLKRPLLYSLISLATIAIVGIVLATWLLVDLPTMDALSQGPRVPSIRIVDRHGRLLYEVIAEESGRHTIVTLEMISEPLINATIATEDSSFYKNPGVDPRGIVRALWINLRGGETLAGGSTITQQVARNLMLEAGERQQRTLRRKLRESLLAWRLAHELSKDEILALYLNHMYFGALAYGVEAAAQTYFGKPASRLDLAESALIAGLLQAPSLYNPLSNPKEAKARQVVVLDLMEKQGLVTTEEKELAVREKLVFAATPYPIEAPHFVVMVREQLEQLVSTETLYRGGGLTVRTTLDLDWQHHAERIIARQLERLNQPAIDSQGRRVRNAALAALDPHSGEILSIVGSPGYFDPTIDGAIDMARAPRQPGSALKPLVYATAIDPKGDDPWTAATMILDVHTAFVTHEGQAYAPVNFDLQEHGPVTLRQALGSSLNIPAVQALDTFGLEALFALAADLGITTFRDPDRYDLSLALGGGEVRLLELVAAYGAFANGGYQVSPTAILEIQDAQGHVLYTRESPEHNQVLDPRVVWLITDILADDDARSLGFGANSVLQIDRPAAVKTGTTTDYRDNWTIGYTPELVVGVWVGNADNQAMLGVTGLSGAGPIWHQFMRTLLVGEPQTNFKRPKGIVQVEVCALSGLLPSDACTYTRDEWFIQGTEPTQRDDVFREVVVDLESGCAATASTPQERRAERLVLDLPVKAHPWARTHGITLLTDLNCEQEAVVRMEGSRPDILRLVAPDGSSVFQLSAAQPRDAQRLRFEAVGSGEMLEVTLWVDGEAIATFREPPYLAWWPLRVGTHRAWAEGVSETGRTVVSETIQFEVLAAED
ncbi:MAG: penicillin-binding protein 1C [Anaerolineales bacterium]|nr:penicillin-binding protein 1C [Anaerolineales bacterium]